MKTGFLLCLLSVCAQAGPPFQTDDPQPIDFRHYEFYTFATSDGTRVETDTAGPAVEFNWGALPNVHLHIIVPAAAIFPSNIPSLAPAGMGPRAFGIGDIELGVKYRFVQETKKRPMIGTFVIVRDALGRRGARAGRGEDLVQAADLGAEEFGSVDELWRRGETIVRAPGYRSYPFAGALLQRDLGKKWTLGAEVFYHGPEGIATAQTRPATMVDVGGYYKFRDPGFQLLFCYGHTVAGQTENYAYLGLYWTWGNKSGADVTTKNLMSLHSKG